MRISKKLLTCLTISLFSITACDELSRFSYENYSCEPRLTSLYEIRISNLKIGAFADISSAKGQTQAEIISLTKKQIIIQSDRQRLIVNRDSGATQIFRGNVYESVPCIIDKFKM